MFEGLSTNQSTVFRAVVFQDTMKAIKDYWILDARGGAWMSAYHYYQSYDYSINQIE